MCFIVHFQFPPAELHGRFLSSESWTGVLILKADEILYTLDKEHTPKLLSITVGNFISKAIQWQQTEIKVWWKIKTEKRKVHGVIAAWNSQ